MQSLIAELEAEQAASQLKSAKALRKRQQKKGVPDTPSVSARDPCRVPVRLAVDSCDETSCRIGALSTLDRAAES